MNYSFSPGLTYKNVAHGHGECDRETSPCKREGQCICCAFTTCRRKSGTKAPPIATLRCRPAFATRAERLQQLSFVSSNLLSCP